MRNAVNLTGRAPASPPVAVRPLIARVFEGLSEQDRQLPWTLLHDAEGSRLFDRVCEQPEWYHARAERQLLQAHGAEIAELAGPQAAVVECEAGAGDALLQALAAPHSYVPIDVDAVRLERRVRRARQRLPILRVQSLHADLREFFTLPRVIGNARRRLAYFPGSAVGNDAPLEAVALLNTIREAIAPCGALLAGVDLLKTPGEHEWAYADAAGAMAAFNRNLLSRLDRELDATFDPQAFGHRATWNEQHQRVEMSLVSLRTQCPSVSGIAIPLAAGEQIVTSHAYRPTAEEFVQLARVAGWTLRRRWLDAEHGYALMYFEADD